MCGYSAGKGKEWGGLEVEWPSDHPLSIIPSFIGLWVEERLSKEERLSAIESDGEEESDGAEESDVEEESDGEEGRTGSMMAVQVLWEWPIQWHPAWHCGCRGRGTVTGATHMLRPAVL